MRARPGRDRLPIAVAHEAAFAPSPRRWASVGVGVGCATLFGCALFGCDEKPVSTPAASATVGASAGTSAAPKASIAPIEKPQPLDLKAIKSTLRCSGKAGSGPCPVLEKFESCREGWSPITQSGDGRWLGEGAIVKEGAFIEDWVVIRSRRVALDEVAPGALGAKIAIDRIPDDESEARSAAVKAFRSFAQGDVPKANNRALSYLNEREEWPEAYAQQADGNQIYVAAGAGAFLCADPATQALHVVRLSGKRDHPADGIYATLYPVKW